MAKDREMHQTMIARQSRSLLQEITEGLWEFMAQLDLTELDIDPVVEQMINFVNSSNQLSFKEKNNCNRIEKVADDSAAETLKYYTPDRVIDDDTLWLKLYFEKKWCTNMIHILLVQSIPEPQIWRKIFRCYTSIRL